MNGKFRTLRSKESISLSMAALHRAIPNLTNRQLESLRRGLIDLLTDVNLEKAKRETDLASD